jgi:transcriptional regulator with XRE-family HTH domain
VPHPVDVHVGGRIRTRRLLVGMNQETLAEELGLTFQQVQKYESGANRVSASRLAEIADILTVPVEYFFSQMDDPETPGDAPDRELREHMRRPDTIEFVRYYYAIPDPEIRRQFMEMIKAVARSAANRS